ncbi:MAG: biotin/lipoyl-binding protein [Chloroflexaceae bacterium]|nr:biotin/lipoyl-binding protein [Chloroflexaceae bacterium]
MTTELPPITASERVIAEAEVVPIQDVELRFESSGTVAEVLVEEADMVNNGDVLARLDTRDLVLDVEDRAAQLAIARAALELLQEGATQEEINEYQARIAQAEATLAERQADINRAQADVARAQGDLLSRQGSVTGSDIEAARAELQEAIAALEDVRDGEDEAVIAQARARVEQFRVNLQAEKDRLAALKVQAEEDVNLRANELRNVQADYSRIYWDVREIERDLNSVEQQTWQELKDREEAALREVQNAESRLEQARIDLEAARLAEINGIQEAEARLEEAQADLEDLLTPPKASNVAAAEARVAAHAPTWTSSRGHSAPVILRQPRRVCRLRRQASIQPRRR